MAVWDRTIVCSVMFLLAGAETPSVIYPFTSTCAVTGSTVTLPCTFTPLKSVYMGGREVSLRVVRVLWCRNHPICQESTPTVYDSETRNNPNDPRAQYLGDQEGNCTLRLRGVQRKHNSTFRFRMEADDRSGHFTNVTGVTVTVVGGEKMRINSSSSDGEVRGGQTVALQCTADCTFHQLEVTWSKDNHTLSESGPVLLLSPLTAKDSGSYTCALKTDMRTVSLQYSLRVEAAEEVHGADGNLPLVAGVVFGVLLAGIALVLVFCIIKRRRAAAEDRRAVGGQAQHKHPDDIYSNVLPSAERAGEDLRPETSRPVEDVSYAAVQFKHTKRGRQAAEAEDAIIYSSVASRG